VLQYNAAMSRPRFQFRLRTLFIATAIVAALCPLGVLLSRRRPSYMKYTFQGVNITVIHPFGGSNSAGKTTSPPGKPANESTTYVISWDGSEPGKMEMTIDNRHLQIDGQDFGTLQLGDNVTVDATKGRAVTVNDQELRPVTKK
jgi:hypothetical protein